MDISELVEELRHAREEIESLAHAVTGLSARMDALQGSKPAMDTGCRGHHRPVVVDDLIADGLTTQTAQEWLDHRRRRRAVLTPRAWDGIKAEAAKAGWTTEDAVRKALARGWTGIEAEWLTRDSKQPANREDKNRAAAALAKNLLFGEG